MATFQPGAPQSLIHPQLVTLRTAGPLLAAGAYDVTPLVVACPSFTRITLLGSYTRAAALGAATMALEFCPTATGAGTWYRLSEIAAGLLAAGADVTNLTLDTSANFIPYDQLTEAKVLEWVQAEIGAEAIQNFYTEVDKKLQQMLQPTLIATDLPWIPKGYVPINLS